MLFRSNQTNLIPQNGPFQNHRYCTSTLFCCQSIQNTLTVFGVNVLLCHSFSTRQAGQTRKGFANLRACPDGCSVLGKQCTEPDPRAKSAPARWEHIPNPEITLCVSCAFSRFRFFHPFDFTTLLGYCICLFYLVVHG